MGPAPLHANPSPRPAPMPRHPVRAQHTLDVVAIVPHFHYLTSELVFEVSIPTAGTRSGHWRPICGGGGSVFTSEGASARVGPNSEFHGGKPLRQPAGSRLRLRAKFDARRSHVLGQMAANTLYFAIDGDRPTRRGRAAGRQCSRCGRQSMWYSRRSLLARDINLIVRPCGCADSTGRANGTGKNGVLASSPPYFCECGVLSFVLQ